MKPDRWMAIDIETDGLPKTPEGKVDFETMRIIEFGASMGVIKPDGQVVIESGLSVLVRGVTISAEIERLTGHTQAQLDAYGVPEAEALCQVVQWALLARDQGRGLVGHNLLEFDAPAIGAALRRAGREPADLLGGWGAVLDTMLLHRAWCLGRRVDGQGVEQFLLEQVGPCKVKSTLSRCLATWVDPEDRIGCRAHTACGDCVATLRVLAAMARRGCLRDMLGKVVE